MGKESRLGLSAVAISTAGICIITMIAVAARKALKTGARAVGKFGKALASLGQKVAPLLGAVLSLVGTVPSLGAKGVEFLSKNLWILALALTYFLYNGIKKKYKKR